MSTVPPVLNVLYDHLFWDLMADYDSHLLAEFYFDKFILRRYATA